MPGQFAPSPRNRTPPLEGSSVSGTDLEERGRLSDPHQIAVRAIYKIPPRTSSAPNMIKNILASSIRRCHAREAVFLRGELTPPGRFSIPPVKRARSFKGPPRE